MAEKCPKCDGCGQVADTDDQEPWTDWLKLPLGSSAAVVMGLVRPMTCPECGGSGEFKQKADAIAETADQDANEG